MPGLLLLRNTLTNKHVGMPARTRPSRLAGNAVHSAYPGPRLLYRSDRNAWPAFARAYPESLGEPRRHKLPGMRDVFRHECCETRPETGRNGGSQAHVNRVSHPRKRVTDLSGRPLARGLPPKPRLRLDTSACGRPHYEFVSRTRRRLVVRPLAAPRRSGEGGSGLSRFLSLGATKGRSHQRRNYRPARI